MKHTTVHSLQMQIRTRLLPVQYANSVDALQVNMTTVLVKFHHTTTNYSYFVMVIVSTLLKKTALAGFS